MRLVGRVWTERRRIVLPLAVLLAANAVVFALAVLPLDESVRSGQAQSIASMGTLAAARIDSMNAKKAQTSKARADSELKTFYGDILPRSFDAARDEADFEIDRIAVAAGVTKKNSHYDYEDVKNSRLVKFTGKIELEGEYASIRRFLYDVETANKFIVIERVELSQLTTTTGSANAIDVTLSVAMYYLAVQAGGR